MVTSESYVTLPLYYLFSLRSREEANVLQEVHQGWEERVAGVEGPESLESPDSVGHQEVLGVGEEEPQPLQPGESEVTSSPDLVLLCEGVRPDLGLGVAAVRQGGAHDRVETWLGEDWGSLVSDEPHLPGVSLSGEAVHPRAGVDAAHGEEDDVARGQPGPQQGEGLPHLPVELQQSQLAGV